MSSHWQAKDDRGNDEAEGGDRIARPRTRYT
jgi:hypothetical protein